MNYDYYDGDRGVERREDILDFIIQFITENNYPPSIREIAQGVGLKSIESVKYYLKILERNKKIKMKPNLSRTISVVGYEFRKAE